MGRLNTIRGWIATTLRRRKKHRPLDPTSISNNKWRQDNQEFVQKHSFCDKVHGGRRIGEKKCQSYVHCNDERALSSAETNERQVKLCACSKLAINDAVHADSTNDAGYASKDDNTDAEDIHAAERKSVAEKGRRSMIKTNPWVGPQSHVLIQPLPIADDYTMGKWSTEDHSYDSSSESDNDNDDDGEDAYLGDSSSVTSVESDNELNVRNQVPKCIRDRNKINKSSSHHSADIPETKPGSPEDLDLSVNDSGFESNTGTQQSSTEPGTPEDSNSLEGLQIQKSESADGVAPQPEATCYDNMVHDDADDCTDFGTEALYRQASTLKLTSGRLSLPSSTLQLYSGRQYASGYTSVWRCASSSGPVYQSNSSLASNASLRREMRLQEDLEERVKGLSDVQRLLELQLKTNSLKAVSQPAMHNYLATEQPRHSPDRHRQWRDDIMHFRCQLMLFRKQRLLMTLQCLRDQLERETKRLERSYAHSVFLQEQWWQALHTARESLV